MLAMRRPRIPQPPIRPRQRGTEDRDFWPAFIVVVVAILLLYTGANHQTRLETLDGHAASATQLIQAFATGGLIFEQPAIPSDPALFDDPILAAAEMDRAAEIADLPLRDRYRVNTGAVDPCPT
jgi:hypothetical protein